MNNDKMTPQESRKFLAEVNRSRSGIMVDRAVAARLAPGSLDVGHACGFVDDCEDAFKKIEIMREVVDRMMEWECVFDAEDAQCIKAMRRHLDNLENVVYHNYKYIEK